MFTIVITANQNSRFIVEKGGCLYLICYDIVYLFLEFAQQCSFDLFVINDNFIHEWKSEGDVKMVIYNMYKVVVKTEKYEISHSLYTLAKGTIQNSSSTGSNVFS